MAFYKLCDCGHKNYYTQKGLAPRKCEKCPRSLLNVIGVDEDAEDDVPSAAEETSASREGSATESFFYSLDAVDGSGTIYIPRSGCIVGRANLGAEMLGSHRAVSREHIKVLYRGHVGLSIEDISKYGTYINGEQMVKGSIRIARDGDIIRLYDFDLIVKKHD